MSDTGEEMKIDIFQRWEIFRQVVTTLAKIGGLVTLEDLLRLAEIRGERPLFLFPDMDGGQSSGLKDTPLDPRKETTLYCLIAVLAETLGYSPGDKDTVGKVKALLDLAGVSMDKKTIRNNIKAAFGALNSKRE